MTAFADTGEVIEGLRSLGAEQADAYCGRQLRRVIR